MRFPLNNNNKYDNVEKAEVKKASDDSEVDMFAHCKKKKS